LEQDYDELLKENQKLAVKLKTEKELHEFQMQRLKLAHDREVKLLEEKLQNLEEREGKHIEKRKQLQQKFIGANRQHHKELIEEKEKVRKLQQEKEQQSFEFQTLRQELEKLKDQMKYTEEYQTKATQLNCALLVKLDSFIQKNGLHKEKKSHLERE